jgi:hypothetical protein
MRKRIVDESPRTSPPPAEEGCLDLETLALVEVTSEDAEHPIESALVGGGGSGWLAAGPGEQVVRLLFDEPQSPKRVRLLFEEGGGGARRSSRCAGRRTAGGLTGRSCASSITSARRARSARPRSTASI